MADVSRAASEGLGANNNPLAKKSNQTNKLNQDGIFLRCCSFERACETDESWEREEEWEADELKPSYRTRPVTRNHVMRIGKLSHFPALWRQLLTISTSFLKGVWMILSFTVWHNMRRSRDDGHFNSQGRIRCSRSISTSHFRSRQANGYSLYHVDLA
jgi:hypothetical protein